MRIESRAGTRRPVGRGGPGVVCVGTVALDTVTSPAGSVRDAPGGSVLYFAAAARRYARVAVVAVAGQDFPMGALEPLEIRGVDVSGVSRVAGPTLRWEVRYDADGTRHVLSADRGVTVGTAPSLGPAHRDADAFFLGSTDPAVQRAVLEQAGGTGLVALDTTTHWVRDRRAELEALMPRVDVLFLNEEELKAFGQGSREEASAATVLRMGVSWLVVRRAGGGASAYNVEGNALPLSVEPVATVAAAHVEDVVDPTGAGDAFAGGVLGALLESGDASGIDEVGMAEALAEGARMGALAVRSFSIGALLEEDE